MTRQYAKYTFQGQVELGKAITYWRESDKPFWVPVVKTGLSNLELEIEKGRWSQQRMADIINREFGLTGSDAVSQSAIHRLENPSLKSNAPPSPLIELITALEIMINPKTGKPFSDSDLKAIAKELLDWRTGEVMQPSYQNSQG